MLLLLLIAFHYIKTPTAFSTWYHIFQKHRKASVVSFLLLLTPLLLLPPPLPATHFRAQPHQLLNHILATFTRFLA